MELPSVRRMEKMPFSFTTTPRIRKPPGAALVPYMQTLTVIILSISLLFWRSRTWNHRAFDLNVTFICLALQYMQQPLLALGLAIGYVVCTSLPGSWESLNLPEYSDFKSKLKILPSSETSSETEDCMVCYDNDNPIARLPCDHKCCTGCLDLMAESYQTTCPACRKPLFSSSDEVLYALHRGSVASMIVNITLLFFVGIQDIRESDWTCLTIRVVSVGAFTPFLYFYGSVMWEHGDNWWRAIHSSVKMKPRDLFMAGFAMTSGILATWSTLWSTRGTFS